MRQSAAIPAVRKTKRAKAKWCGASIKTDCGYSVHPSDGGFQHHGSYQNTAPFSIAGKL